jgi:hypothetical protein
MLRAASVFFLVMFLADAFVNFDLAIVECYYGWQPWDFHMILSRFTFSELHAFHLE